MKAVIINDVGSTSIEPNNIKEYKVSPVIIYSEFDKVKTSNVFSDSSTSESSSNNPDEFKLELTKIYPKFKLDVLHSVHETMIESGVHYYFEDVFDEYFKKNHHMAAQLLQKLLRENYTNIKIVKVILHIVSHYTYDEIGDDFEFPFLSLLGHENKAIRKFALKAFDNWDSVDTMNMLKGTMPMREKWLNDYKNSIIKRLERKNNNAIFFTCN